MAGEPELLGLEWEAEKAYIVATSPRSAATNGHQSLNDDQDDFSWEEKPTARPVTVVPPVVIVSSVDESSSETNVPLATGPPVTIDPVSTDSPIATKPSTDIPAATGPMTTTPSTNVPAVAKPITTGPPVTIVPATHFTADDDIVVLEPLAKPTKSIDSSPKSSPSSSSTAVQSIASFSAPSPGIIIIYGPSGLGRSTLVKKLIYLSPQQFSPVISHTTRQPQPNEMYARDYFFVSRADMLQKIRQEKFMEYVQIDRFHCNVNSYSGSVTPRKSITAFSPTSVIKAAASEGDLYGTTWDAFREARYSGKPWVVFNVSTKGAEQLKDLGVEGHYLLMGEADESSDRLVPNHVISLENLDEAFGLLEDHMLDFTQGLSSGKPASQLAKAEEEWERVPSIQLMGGKLKSKQQKQRLSPNKITFVELLSHFQSSNLSQQLSLIKPESSRSRLSRVLGPPRIDKKLQYERNLFFAIALCKFDDRNTFHTRGLFTVYQCLTGGANHCPRFGPHWEDVGFQGSDPTDDFRGVGMLGLLQLVWFLDTPEMNSIAMDIYRYSKSGPHPLPFCVISLNITCIVLQALRDGCLSKECNRLEEVFGVCNNFYAAIFLSFFHNWRRHQKGVMELGNVLQDVGNFARKHSRFMTRELKNAIESRQKDVKSSSNPAIVVEPSIIFSEITEQSN